MYIVIFELEDSFEPFRKNLSLVLDTEIYTEVVQKIKQYLYNEFDEDLIFDRDSWNKLKNLKLYKVDYIEDIFFKEWLDEKKKLIN